MHCYLEQEQPRRARRNNTRKAQAFLVRYGAFHWGRVAACCLHVSLCCKRKGAPLSRENSPGIFHRLVHILWHSLRQQEGLQKFQLHSDRMTPEEAALVEFAPMFEHVGKRMGLKPELLRERTIAFIEALMVKDLDEPGGLPPALDDFWHRCILYTEDYEKLCMRLRGRFIHHTPRSADDAYDTKRSRIDKTVHALRKRYKREPPPELYDDHLLIDDVQERFSLVVRQINGKVTVIEALRAEHTIATVKKMIQAKTGISACEQRLVYAGKNLDDVKTLGDYNIWHDNICLHLLLSVRGC